MSYPDNWSTTPGIYEGIPNDVYHADREAVSRSWLKELTTPLHLQAYLDEQQETVEHLGVGTAFHCLCFELLDWPNQVAVLPEKFLDPKTGLIEPANMRKPSHRAAKAAFIEANSGKAILTPAEHEHVETMYESVERHPRAMALLNGCKAEVVVVWQDSARFRERIQKYTAERIPGEATGLYCKAKLDGFKPDFVVDLKSAQSADYKEFQRACDRFRYDLQPPFYLDGLLYHGHQFDNFIFLVIENKKPYGLAQYRLPHHAVEFARIKYFERLNVLGEMKERGQWPGKSDDVFPGYPDQIIDFDFAPWYYKS